MTRLVWPAGYDLRRIGVRDPPPVYPLSPAWRGDNTHPGSASRGSRRRLIGCQLEDPAIGHDLAAGLGDEHQRPRRRPAFKITKTSEAVCMQDAVSEWPTAAIRRFRGGYHGA